MELQALRYAAMVANMTYQQAVDTFQAYLGKRANTGGGNEEDDDAENIIRQHLERGESDSEAIHTEVPRLILASENFGKELTTCVMWLNDSWLRDAGQEIKCIRLRPHRNGNEVLIETSVVIPLPEAGDYEIRAREAGAGNESAGKREAADSARREGFRREHRQERTRDSNRG